MFNNNNQSMSVVNYSELDPLRSFGERTKNFVSLWTSKGLHEYAESFDTILSLFSQLDLPLSTSDVQEIVHIATRVSGRPRSSLSFGEFAFYVSYYRESRKGCSNRVFLGGSCNPTTWRTELAIPFLESHAISYFNPQLDDWSPELIQLEHEAKESSEILLFVLNPQTRNVVSMIEMAFFSGSNRKILPVIQRYPAVVVINDQVLLENEVNELISSVEYLTSLIKNVNERVFEQISDALSYIYSITSKNLEIENALIQCKKAFDYFDKTKSGLISSEDASLAFKNYTRKTSELAYHVTFSSENTALDFNAFCSFVSEFYGNSHSQAVTGIDIESFSLNIYIGGCFSESSDRICVCSALDKIGATYLFGQNKNGKKLKSDLSVVSKCKFLFFFITELTIGLTDMIEAAYHIGKRSNIVLVIRNVSKETVGDRISSGAIRDYNRGREYLSDMAYKKGIPVTQDLTEGLKILVNKIES